MKRSFFYFISLMTVFFTGLAALIYFEGPVRGSFKDEAPVTAPPKGSSYEFPDFYRGLYLANDSACNPGRFRSFFEVAVQSHINTLVMDVQTSSHKERMVPAAHVSECVAYGIHPVARVVVFPGGLAAYPPSEESLREILRIAERAAKAGFREIQFDYIRFSDEGRRAARLKSVSLQERYRFIESFLARARTLLAPYGVRIAADIFGRVPHNTNDRIGQKMEVFDRHVDVICPMAYPSHYWTKKLRHDPYGTVLWTSTEADRRTGKAAIVTWIQAFKMRHPPGMSMASYIQRQIQAVHDAKVSGFLLWNARQDYDIALKAVKDFYGARKDGEKHAM